MTIFTLILYVTITTTSSGFSYLSGHSDRTTTIQQATDRTGRLFASGASCEAAGMLLAKAPAQPVWGDSISADGPPTRKVDSFLCSPVSVEP